MVKPLARLSRGKGFSYFGRGWGRAENFPGRGRFRWALGRSSVLVLQAPASGTYRLSFDAVPFGAFTNGKQRLALTLKSGKIAEFILGNDWGNYAVTLHLPAHSAVALLLQHNRAARTKRDARHLAAAYQNFALDQTAGD